MATNFFNHGEDNGDKLGMEPNFDYKMTYADLPDIFFNGRILDSLDVAENPQTNIFDLAEDHQPPYTGELRTEGYLGGDLVAVNAVQI